MKQKHTFGLLDLLGVTLTLALLRSSESLLGDPGVGWHLKAGELIARSHVVVRNDPFLLWEGTAKEWIHDQWLSDVLLWLVYALGGFPLLHVLTAAITVGTFVLVLSPLVAQNSKSGLCSFLFLLLGALVSGIQWFVRPVIFSVFLFACTYRFAQYVLSLKQNLQPLILFTPVFFLWANLHAAFWLGLGIFFALLVELVLERKIAFIHSVALAGLALAMTLINPWQVALWKSTLGLAFDSYFTKLNQEWLPPDFREAAFWPFLIGALLLGIGSLKTSREHLARFDIFLLLPLLVLSFFHRRYLPFLGVLLPLPLVKLYPEHLYLSRVKVSLGRPMFTLIFWVLMGISALTLKRIPLLEAHTSEFPRGFPHLEVELILREPAPVFHSPDVGGYLTWMGYPEVKPFIDDRNQLLGRERYEEYFQVVRGENNWSEILKKWKVKWILVGREMPIVTILNKSPQWKVIDLASPTSPWVLYRAEGG